MLHYDARYREYTDKPVQQNVDWLDFTHALTHLISARQICSRQGFELTDFRLRVPAEIRRVLIELIDEPGPFGPVRWPEVRF